MQKPLKTAELALMRILFCTGGMAVPEMIGGSQRTAGAIIKLLSQRGHTVALSAALGGSGFLGLTSKLQLRILGRGFSCDRHAGYLSYRSWSPEEANSAIIRHFRPDVAVILAHRPSVIGSSVKVTGTPFVMAFQDVEIRGEVDAFKTLGHFDAVANSQFTADRFREMLGITSVVINPLIEEDVYKRLGKNGNAILFINPVAQKGVEKAIDIAVRMPDREFIFVMAWPLNGDQRETLDNSLKNVQNVTLIPATSDMKSVYARGKLLLVPSQWEEGYGRVASEAQFAGIPVVGSNRGGLPEAIGPGGEIVPHDSPTECWMDAIEKVLSPQSYSKYCEAASTHVNRNELKNGFQIDLWETVLFRVTENKERLTNKIHPLDF